MQEQVQEDRSPFQYSATRKRRRVQTVNELPSMTVQSDRNRSEIRHILAKFEQTGVLIGARQVDLEFRDVTEFDDFADVMRQVKVAEGRFMALPPEVRAVFDNDPARWLDAAHDAEKLAELRPRLEKIGFLEAVAGPSGPEQGGAEPVPPPAS